MNIDELTRLFSKLDTTSLVLLFLLLTAMLIANILYFRTLQRTMGTLSPELRPLAPAMIWLALLPILGLFWYMAYIVMLSVGLQKELAKRKLPGNGAITITLATVILSALCLIPTIQQAVVPLTMVFWVVHWQRMALHYKLLAEPEYLLVE